MLEAFLACSGAVFERGNRSSGLGRADVVLRFRVGRALSWRLVTLLGNAGRTFSREDVLDLSAVVRYSNAQIPNLWHSSAPYEFRRFKGSLCLL